MITVVHGGQTGVDRGAHEAAIDNGWLVEGYMPADGRDEYGQIPPEVARHLRAHSKPSYAARTEANVWNSDALLVIVRDADDPRSTPGTAKTIDLAADRHLPRRIIDTRVEDRQIATWIWHMSVTRPLFLALDPTFAAAPLRLMIAGPRESKWDGARIETAGLLRRVSIVLRSLAGPMMPKKAI